MSNEKVKKEVEKLAMNIVYQLDDDANLSVEFRQANNDKRIDFVMKLLLAKLKERDEKWKIAIGYNCEPEQIDRILEAVKALNADRGK